jgi:CHAD domain-containing protein
MPTDEKQEHLSINQFLETQLALFREHFVITRQNNDEEAIHKMRLAIKRIRTIHKLKKHLHLQTILTEEFYLILKSVFAASGKLRDIQVHQGLLAKYADKLRFSFSGLAEFLVETEKSTIDSLKQAISGVTFEQDSQLQTDNLDKEQQPENCNIEAEIIDYIKCKISFIEMLLFGHHNEENVHEIRKQVKQLYYILQFVKGYCQRSCLADYDLAAIDDLGNNLGSWHDRVVLKDRILEFAVAKGDNFMVENVEYQILLYVLADEKQKILRKLTVNLYLEMIILRVLLGENAPKKSHKPIIF